MEYMLDTSTCVYLINRHPKIRRTAPPERCAISVIVFGELERAACLSDHADVISDFTKRINIVALEHNVACAYADMRLYLESEGRTMGPNALWIAAHATALGLTLVSTDTQTFRRIPELSVTTWLDD